MKKKGSLILIIFGLLWTSVGAQDLEPRFLSMMPTRGNVVIPYYGYSIGNVLLDNSLPIEGLQAGVNTVGVGYVRSFNLFSRLAKVDVVVPSAFAKWDGNVSGIDSSTRRIGLGDPLIRLSVILIGGKAFKPSEYFNHEPSKFRLGLQFRIRIPLGQYDPSKLLNIGLNRWGFKSGVGVSYRIRKLTMEAFGNVWLFTSNNDFFNHNEIRQRPVITIQGHVAYEFRKGLWIAASFGASWLGETILNGEAQNNDQNNTRYGLTFALPLARNHALKIAYTGGLSTRYGADFNTFIVAYQFVWFQKNKRI